jgi:hypothetical protein
LAQPRQCRSRATGDSRAAWRSSSCATIRSRPPLHKRRASAGQNGRSS